MDTPVLQKDTRPHWLKKRLASDEDTAGTRAALAECGVNTVCESSRCPNLAECFSRAHATFLILGKNCTRSCGFCSVAKDAPGAVDAKEPERIADAVERLKLRYVVITSVTRDDLADGGALQFAETIRAVKRLSMGIPVEVLVPDFGGRVSSVRLVVEAPCDVFGHNIETVMRLYPVARKGARYDRSLGVLKLAKSLAPDVTTKSGIMLGLGERDGEIVAAMRDIRSAGCDMLTIGQYLMPAQGSLPVKRFYEPAEFDVYASLARDMGFRSVSSGPFVRSSYMAQENYDEIKGVLNV